MKHRKIMFYSHDTFGLGHIRRTQKLANQIAAPDRSILILCSSPKASSFDSAPGIEYLNLPGFTKLHTGEYQPRNLQIPLEEFVNLRAQVILTAVRAMQPEVFVIDKEPLGVKRELLPALRYLRESVPGCKIVCGFRDILDEPGAVKREWEKRGTLHALETYFDHVLIYGEREHFDFAAEYGLPAKLAQRLIYTGYVLPPLAQVREFSLPLRSGAPVVTFTLGGGEDGAPILETALEMISAPTTGFNSVLLTGPFVAPSLLRRAHELEKRHPNVLVIDFTDNPLGLFKRSSLVVSMGGYNAMTELAALGLRTLIIPRIHPRMEQWMRARIFQKNGFCEWLDSRELTPDSLYGAIERGLAQRAMPVKPFPQGGAEKFAQLFSAGGALA